MHKNFLLKHTDTISVFKALKYSVSVTFDVEELTKISFNTLKPFPKRKEIQQKQRAFFKELTTKWEKKKINDARAFYEETESIHDLRISYACFVNDKEIWVCSGKQAEGIVMVANTETRKMAVQNFN
ncbi:BMA-TBC- isoform, partial [Brachionus plicatilis]